LQNGSLGKKKSAMDDFLEEIDRDLSRSEAPSNLKLHSTRDQGGRKTPVTSLPLINDDKIIPILSNLRNSSMGIFCEKKRKDDTFFADFEFCLQKFNARNIKG